MTHPFRIAPSILSADFCRLGDEVQAVLDAGADWVHVDVMDGIFVPNITIGQPIVAALRKRFPDAFLDVHLMIQQPERYVESFVAAGANLLTVHAEACLHLHRVTQQIRTTGAMVGVSLNPHTPLEVLDWVLEEIDLVLIMSVNPGFGGQKFIPSALQKVAALRERANQRGLKLQIEVDGGVSAANIGALAAAGANAFVAGNAIFAQPNYAAPIAAMRAALAAP